MTVPALYVSDLDGTLLADGGELTDASRNGLRELLDAGTPMTIASARSHFSIRSIFGAMPFRLPIIEFNGAFVTDYATGEHLEVNALDPALAFELFDRVVSAGQRPFVSSYNGREDCLHYDQLMNPGMEWYEARRRAANDPRLRQTVDLRGTMAEQVVSLTVMDQSEARIRALHEELGQRYGSALQLYCYENEYSKGTWWLTIHDQRASKHIAMKSLRDRHHPGARIVAIGDNVNDIEMLKAADRAIAVDNAVPELRAVADEIIGHHADDAVIAFLRRETEGMLTSA